MKKVVDNSEVAHFWANKVQSEARNAHNNFYFSGNTIYSYGSHFPIAKHVENDKGESAVLFTERKYSNTTSKHISYTWQAARHLNKIECYNPGNTHNDNFNNWLIEIENIAANLLKAKKPEIYLNQIAAVSDKANKYASFFSLAIPEKLQIALSIQNKDQYSSYTAKKEELRISEEKKHKKELAARHKKELAKWLKGETDRLYTHNGLDYLRLMGDKIETSQGIDLTIPYGITVYNKLKADSLKVGDKILHYNVNKINGVVAIGCHTFKKDYLLKFGKQLTELSK